MYTAALLGDARRLGQCMTVEGQTEESEKEHQGGDAHRYAPARFGETGNHGILDTPAFPPCQFALRNGAELCAFRA
jgi:hypothetical protein